VTGLIPYRGRVSWHMVILIVRGGLEKAAYARYRVLSNLISRWGWFVLACLHGWHVGRELNWCH
jgi:hypothetical protein